jgi:hypothetical protein
MTLAAGSRLGPYEILSLLGAGGMGEVYRARDTRLSREVAVKVLPAAVASDPDRLSRFEKEARSASSLNHPNIVTIHDIGEAGGASFIAMELVSGQTLRQLLAEGSLAIKRLLAIAAQVADGLARAHAAGIVHRDLKPENIMVTKDGLVKILEFRRGDSVADGLAGDRAGDRDGDGGLYVARAGARQGARLSVRPVLAGFDPLRDGDGQEGVRTGEHARDAGGNHSGGAGAAGRDSAIDTGPAALDRRTVPGEEPR